jgi:hypothetical protein
VALAVFVLVILVDNVFARLKWQAALKSAWLVTLVFGFGNILALALFSPKPAIPAAQAGPARPAALVAPAAVLPPPPLADRPAPKT